jgi:hypothetical protein
MDNEGSTVFSVSKIKKLSMIQLRMSKKLQKKRKKQSWPNLRYYPGFCLKAPCKTAKILIKDSKSGPHTQEAKC